MKIHRTEVNSCRVQKLKYTFLFLLYTLLFLFFRKINIYKNHIHCVYLIKDIVLGRNCRVLIPFLHVIDSLPQPKIWFPHNNSYFMVFIHNKLCGDSKLCLSTIYPFVFVPLRCRLWHLYNTSNQKRTACKDKTDWIERKGTENRGTDRSILKSSLRGSL